MKEKQAIASTDKNQKFVKSVFCLLFICEKSGLSRSGRMVYTAGIFCCDVDWIHEFENRIKGPKMARIA